MKIYTFYNPIPGFKTENELGLIELWKTSWSQHGYEPIVIGDAEAKANPRFNEFDSRLSKLPTINGYAYEGACYRRWLAMEHVAGGPCLMSDYDVMCYGDLGLNPSPDKLVCFSLVGNEPGAGEKVAGNPHFLNDAEGVERILQSPGSPPDATFAWVVPCLVYGNKGHYSRIVDMMMNHKTSSFDWIFNRRPHTSDQFIITQNRYAGVYDVEFKCMEAFRGAWKTAPAVHYPNGVMTPNGLTPRHANIISQRRFFVKPNRLDIPAIQKDLGIDGPGFEIGVANGELTDYLAPRLAGKLYAVDPWRIFPKDEWFDCINSSQANLDSMARGAIARLSKNKNVEVWRLTSKEAAGRVRDGSAAWVFIDANHMYEACLEDIGLWWPKIKAGGFLCGHDYCEADNVKTDYVEIGVGKAVRKFCKDNNLSFDFGFGGDGMWIIYK